MPYQLLKNDPTEYEAVQPPEGPTGKQQRKVNRLQIRAAHIDQGVKERTCSVFGWDTEECENDLSLHDYLIKACRIAAPEFDAPLNDETRDKLLVGEAQDLLVDFFNRCGGESGGRQDFSAFSQMMMKVLASLNGQNQENPMKSMKQS